MKTNIGETLQRQTHVVKHLAGAHFKNDKFFYFFGKNAKPQFGKWPESDRAEKSHVNFIMFAQAFYRAFRDTSGGSISHYYQFGIINIVFFITYFIFGDDIIFTRQFPVVFFHINGIQNKAMDEFAFAFARSAQNKIVAVLSRFRFFKNNRFHHLSHHAVSQNHHRCAVFVGEIESVHRQVGQFLAGGRSENYRAVISVAAAARRLKIISL